MLPTRLSLKKSLIGRLRVKGWKEINKAVHITANINQRKAEAALLFSDKVDFRAMKIIREEHYIMKKGSTYQEDTAILNMHAPNNKATKYVNLKLRTKRRNRETQSSRWRLHHLSVNN